MYGSYEQNASAPVQGKWKAAKLVLAILMLAFFVLVTFQSCAAGLGNALAENNEGSGAIGFLCALLFLAAGVTGIAVHKSPKKGGCITVCILCWIIDLLASFGAGSYSDLRIWGIIAFIFGCVFLFSVLGTAKQVILGVILSVLFFGLFLVIGLLGKTDAAPAKDAAPAGDAAVVQVQTQDAGEETEAWEVGTAKVNIHEDSIGVIWVQVMAPVTNTGSVNLYLTSGTVDLEDASGHLVDSLSLVPVYPEVLQPGETAWYYEETTLDEKPDGELTAVVHEDVEKATIDAIRYDVTDLSVTDEPYSGVKVTGRVANTTQDDQSLVYVTAFLYDANDEMIAQTFTILDELKAGDQVGFSMSTLIDFGLTAADVARAEVIAYPTQFQF